MKPIKVLQCFHNYANPTQSWSYRLLKHCADHGIENWVASLLFSKTNSFSNRFKFIEFPVMETTELSANVPWGQRLFNAFAKMAIRLFYPYWVTHLVKNAGIQVVHGHFANVAWRYRKVARRLNVPLVVSFYGYDYAYLPFTEPIWQKRYQRLFKMADCFICEGEHGARLLQKNGCPAEKIRIVRLGIEADSVQLVQREKQKGSLNLVQVAVFNEKKGHEYTVRAFAEARKFAPNMTLTLVGEPFKTGARIAKLIESLGLTDEITVLDHIDFDELSLFLAGFHVFVHPSITTDQMDCEGGAPVVLLDAQATGMPVISSFHCDIPAEVVHQKTGILCPEKDVDAVKEAMLFFYHLENEHYQVFAQNARQHVIENYSIAKNAAELAALYAELARKH